MGSPTDAAVWQASAVALLRGVVPDAVALLVRFALGLDAAGRPAAIEPAVRAAAAADLIATARAHLEEDGIPVGLQA